MSASDPHTFLSEARVPLRLSLAREDQPIIVPLWFIYEQEALWCACHRSSYLVKRIKRDAADPAEGLPCAFDVSTNDAPYKGVRGVGRVTLNAAMGGEKLERLAGRYLDNTQSDFASWLLSRRDDEEALCIRPERLYAWDFSERMSR